MKRQLSRRECMATLGVTIAAGCVESASSRPVGAKSASRMEPFTYGLNTSTLRGHNLSLVEEIDVAAKAGYGAIEPWIGELDDHQKKGGSLRDIRNRLSDRGLAVESAIGFFEWIVDDDTKRNKALEEARRNMDMVAQIGGKRIAAPPLGATDSSVDLLRAAERYRALLDLGDRMGVVPQAELWGFSKTMGRLGEAALVAVESHHPSACILPDVYHLYRGGSDFAGLKLLSGAAFHVLHVNDYPARPSRERVQDSDRVFPGDGVAPLAPLFRDLNRMGFRGTLSLELFNPTYWKQDALTVAKTGLEKTRALVRRSLQEL